jgi:hypothetical protein
MLLNIKNNLLDIKNSDILYNIYYNLAELPKVEQLKKYYKNIKNPKQYIDELRIEISKIDNFIPLYSVFSKNIYLVKPEEVYSKIINNYNRPLTEDLYKYLKNIKTNDKILKEKIQKNINFMNNFDFVYTGKSKEDYNIDKIITKKTMIHLQKFFNKKYLQISTKNNRNNKNKTKHKKTVKLYS